MGWFDEQIKERKRNDNEVFTDSFLNLAGAVMGERFSAALRDNRRITKNALDEILKYYHIKPQEISEGIKEWSDQLEAVMRPHGIMRRTVQLTRGWHKDAMGAMLGIRASDGQVVALLPYGMSGYRYLDRETGRYIKITDKNENLFETEAICFYKSFPLRRLTTKDLVRYALQTISAADMILFGLASLLITLLGLLIPKINQWLFSDVIQSGENSILIAISVFLLSVVISTTLIRGTKSLIMAKITMKMDTAIQAATMMRILSLPADFFKRFSAGELSARAEYVNEFCRMLMTEFVSTGLSAALSIVYIGQIFSFAKPLVLPAVCIILVNLLLSVGTVLLDEADTEVKMTLRAKENGLSYALITGIQKIRLSGAEKRAFAKWANIFAEQADEEYNPPMLVKLAPMLTLAVSSIGTLVLFYSSMKAGISVADYYAFTVAFGMVSGAFLSLSSVAGSIAKLRPILQMVRPMLDEEPEIAEGKHVLERLTGGIELNNVSFRYDDSMPNVLDDISLKIRPGQYIALVGKTGCGKSTLLRLLLGFERPKKGAIYYDGKDLNSIDLKSLRRRIGVVMQDAKLFKGDIFSNITISAPQLTLKDAWEAAEMAGIADDIRNMPMGMHTMVSEGSGGISGGQRQRLIIARAIAPKPKVLMFDEATSALDNLTQKKVSEALDSLKSTRIVIAHRLSTIKHCHRILVLDQGKIIEDGTYEELMAKKGFFAELVERQRVDQND